MSHLGVPHLHRHLLTVQLGRVHLADRSGSDWSGVELLKHLVDRFAVNSLNSLYCLGELVLRTVFSKDLKFTSHVLTDYVSTVAQVLKGFYPDNSCFLDCVEEEVQPPSSSALEQVKGQTDETGSENDAEFDEPEYRLGGFGDAVLFGGAEEEFMFGDVVVEGVAVLIVVEEIVDGGAGHGYNGVLEGIDIPEDFGLVGSEN